MSKPKHDLTSRADIEAALAGRCLTPGQRKNGDAMARLLQRVIDGGLDEDWFDEAADEVSCWEEYMREEDLREAAARVKDGAA